MDGAGGIPIRRQVKPRYASKNEEIVAKLREEAGAGPPINREMRLKRMVAEIAIEMAILHGGDWRIQFEPENGLVQIVRRL